MYKSNIDRHDVKNREQYSNSRELECFTFNNRTIRQKINEEMEDLNSSIVEMHLAVLYQQFYATEVEYTFFLNTEKNFQNRSHDG